MADKACTVRTRKFMTNRLLARKQFVSGALLALHFPIAPGLCNVATVLFPDHSLDLMTECWYTVLQIIDVLHPGRANVSKVSPESFLTPYYFRHQIVAT
jgi:hypothetical protein